MTKEKFISLAVSSGYTTPQEAEAYCQKEDKEEYENQDFVNVYRNSTSSHFIGQRVKSRGIAGPFTRVLGKTTAGCGWHHAG